MNLCLQSMMHTLNHFPTRAGPQQKYKNQTHSCRNHYLHICRNLCRQIWHQIYQMSKKNQIWHQIWETHKNHKNRHKISQLRSQINTDLLVGEWDEIVCFSRQLSYSLWFKRKELVLMVRQTKDSDTRKNTIQNSSHLQ